MKHPSIRLGLPEDIDYDPEHKRQRQIASWMIGRLLNVARGRFFFDAPRDASAELDAFEIVAVQMGILTFDERHHAPKCPANHFHHTRMPDGPCTCGAARAQIR